MSASVLGHGKKLHQHMECGKGNRPFSFCWYCKMPLPPPSCHATPHSCSQFSPSALPDFDIPGGMRLQLIKRMQCKPADYIGQLRFKKVGFRISNCLDQICLIKEEGPRKNVVCDAMNSVIFPVSNKNCNFLVPNSLGMSGTWQSVTWCQWRRLCDSVTLLSII